MAGSGLNGGLDTLFKTVNTLYDLLKKGWRRVRVKDSKFATRARGCLQVFGLFTQFLGAFSIFGAFRFLPSSDLNSIAILLPASPPRHRSLSQPSLSAQRLQTWPLDRPKNDPANTIQSLCRMADTLSFFLFSLIARFFFHPAFPLQYLAQHTPQSTVQHHRLAYATLAEQFVSGLHAPHIKAKTPAEIEAVEADAATASPRSIYFR